MLSAEDNKLLTESGSGTPMGELLRRFWLPVLVSEELPEADGTPKKLTVMGEELLAFRDTRGRVGVIDQHCPHRGANLWLGRNEECGIRCVYHGWKFDTDGRCVDMPTSYPDLNAKDLIRIKSYPVREWGGMIWAYMGPPERMPELPALEMALVPASHRYVTKKWQDCNWVQAMEGSIDTAHFTFAHLSFDKGEDEDLDIQRHLASPMSRMSFDHVRWIADDPRPVIKVNAARRRPDHRRRPHRPRRQHLLAHRPVPDAGACLCAERDAGREYFRPEFCAGDRHQLLDLHLCLESGAAAHAGRARDVCRAGNGVISEVDENYMPLRNKANDYLIDRKLQKTRSYTGIKGVSEQDAAVQDSQGPIADRTREHLGPTDLGIMHFRKLVMDCARDLQRGTEPEAAMCADRYAVRAGASVTHKSKDLTAVMIERFGDPAGYVGVRAVAAAK